MRNSCKHYREGFCYCEALINHLGWDWLKEKGKLEVPCTLQFEVPARACGFRWEELTCDTCKHYEEN